MRFGKIEYLNLLPFDVFVKRCRATTSFKMAFQHKKAYPAKLNEEFLMRRIDAGFISSIAGMKSYLNRKTCKAGIIAYKEVRSVLILDSKPMRDYQSATSNALCDVLGLRGEVLIGDRALKYYYDIKRGNSDNKYIDMAQAWFNKTKLPFVFGLACFHGYGNFYHDLIANFIGKSGKNTHKKHTKIPHYILMRHTEHIGIDKKFAQEYLKCIYYEIRTKERTALERFYREIRLQGVNVPKRF